MGLTRTPWKRQPQIAVGIDWGNPSANGIAFLAPLGIASKTVDIVSNTRGTATGLGTYSPSVKGAYPVFGASNFVDYATNPTGIDGTTPITIAWSQEPRSQSGYNAVLQWKPTGASKSYIIYQHLADSTYGFTCGPATGAANAANFSTAMGDQVNGVANSFILQLLAGTDSTDVSKTILWRNGVRYTTASGATFGNATAAVFRIGALGSGSDSFDGLIGNFHIWRRVISDTEAARWTAGGEFGLLKPLSSQIWVGPGAAAALPTLSASTYKPGTLTATGWQPRVTAS